MAEVLESGQVVAGDEAQRRDRHRQREGEASLGAVHRAQTEQGDRAHQDVRQRLDEPEVHGRLAVVRPEDAVQQEEVGEAVVVGERDDEGDPGQARQHDPGDAAQPVPDPLAALRGRGEVEAREVVPRQREQEMGAALHVDDMDVRADDQDDRRGPQRDARLQCALA